MADNIAETVDENTRRYYLDVMGIQCWEPVQPDVDSGNASASQTDIIEPQEGTDLRQLELEIQRCDKCRLHTGRTQAISGRGHSSPALMFVLLSPDQNDDDSGMLCSGEANTLFSKMLGAIDIAIDDVYITSLLKCRVPANHTVSMSEVSQCMDYLKRQVEILRPRLLVVLGDAAARCMLQRDVALDDLRAEINAGVQPAIVSNSDGRYEKFESVPLFVSYSPQELIQQPENKRKAWQDLQQIQQILGHPG